MRNLGFLIGALAFSFACAPTVRRVEFLADADCGRTAVGLTSLEGIHINATCDDDGAVHMTVTNIAGSARGNLHAFSLAFCGTAMNVVSPEGWVSRFVEQNPEPHVEFKIRDETGQSFSIPPGKTLDGFAIRLSAGWRRKAASGASWDNGAAERVMTHDWCK